MPARSGIVPLMDHISGLQILGYAASILIATSLLMRSIVRLRLFNMAGSATMAIYGVLIGAYPVAVLSFLSTTINLVQLARLRRRREIFRTIEIRGDSPYLDHFLTMQAADIARFFPRFHFERGRESEGGLVALVLRDLVPAGLLLGTIRGERLDVHLDYVVPQFRDLKVGRFLFQDEVDFFRSRGVREIVSAADTEQHAKYLERIGFTRTREGTYRLVV